MDKYKTNKQLLKECKKEGLLPTICPSCGYAIGMATYNSFHFFCCPACRAEWTRTDDPINAKTESEDTTND